jgi:hypothetical protein
MIGTEFKVPVAVCESGVLRVVGSEPSEYDKRVKIRGVGETIYWCSEVVDGVPRGNGFAVGSDEFTNWEAL